MLTLEALGWALQIIGMAIVVGFLGLITVRARMDARNRQVEAAVRAVEPVLHSWLVDGADVLAVRQALRGLPPHAAFRALARLVTQQVTLEHQQMLAQVLRAEPWVHRILRRARSRAWWRRFDAARLLCVVGDEADARVIAALMGDDNPAVRLVAIDAAARLPGRALVDKALDALEQHQDAVQAYQIAKLSSQPMVVADALIDCLTPDASVPRLAAWIEAAGALADPRVLERVCAFASHEHFEVRARVAAALRRYASPDVPAILLRLLADDDWRVRAQAARALGALHIATAASALATAACDRVWWVRFRSALALAQIGGSARPTLEQLTCGPDRLARDMSTLVAGLSSTVVVELAET